MCFENLALAHFFNCLLNFPLFFFAEDLVENINEACLSWDISFFEDSDDEPSSISQSSDDLSHYHYLIHPRRNCIFFF